MNLKKFGKNNSSLIMVQGAEKLLFIPALFFVAFGLLAIVAPKFILVLIASFFLFVGLIAGFVAWKLIQLRRKFDGVMKDFNGKVFIKTAGQQHPFEFEEDLVVEHDKKKILYH